MKYSVIGSLLVLLMLTQVFRKISATPLMNVTPVLFTTAAYPGGTASVVGLPATKEVL